MLCICGKSGSGKTTIVNELLKNGWKKVVQYTTRPPRDGEVNGIDYYFISVDEFLNKVKGGFFVEWQVYNTIEGNWYYGSTMKDYFGDKKVAILPPKSLVEVKTKLQSLKIYSIYIVGDDKWLHYRGDNVLEMNRRKHTDDKDFKNIYNIVDSSIKNDGTLDINLIADMISYAYYDWKQNFQVLFK